MPVTTVVLPDGTIVVFGAADVVVNEGVYRVEAEAEELDVKGFVPATTVVVPDDTVEVVNVGAYKA